MQTKFEDYFPNESEVMYADPDDEDAQPAVFKVFNGTFAIVLRASGVISMGLTCSENDAMNYSGITDSRHVLRLHKTINPELRPQLIAGMMKMAPTMIGRFGDQHVYLRWNIAIDDSTLFMWAAMSSLDELLVIVGLPYVRMSTPEYIGTKKIIAEMLFNLRLMERILTLARRWKFPTGRWSTSTSSDPTFDFLESMSATAVTDIHLAMMHLTHMQLRQVVNIRSAMIELQAASCAD